jgi:hypothetical protein
MGWARRINSKKYAFGTVVNLGFALYAGLPSHRSAWWLSFVVISAVLNHFFTVEALSKVAEVQTEEKKRGAGTRIFSYLILKTLFLAVGFICLMIFAPDKVLQGLMIYIFQLIIFGLSIKNIGKFFKKGSPT